MVSVGIRDFCKIVGRTCGNVSYRDTIFALHDSLKALAECTVSACADEQVVTVMAGIFRPFCGIIAALGCVYCYIVSGFCEFVHYCTEFLLILALPATRFTIKYIFFIGICSFSRKLSCVIAIILT